MHIAVFCSLSGVCCETTNQNRRGQSVRANHEKVTAMFSIVSTFFAVVPTSSSVFCEPS